MDHGGARERSKFLVARSVFLRIAEYLRARSDPVNPNEYMHSPLVAALRHEVIECEYLFDASLARMIGFSALHAHPNADLEKAGASTHACYIDALSRLPYVTGGRSGADLQEQERKSFFKRYEDYRGGILKQV